MTAKRRKKISTKGKAKKRAKRTTVKRGAKKKSAGRKVVKKVEYVAPPRTHIKEEVLKVLEKIDPPVDPKLVNKLDWWALYTIHQDVVKDGKDPAELVRRLVKGYDPEKIRAEQARAAEKKKREEERMVRAKEAERKKAEAKRKAAASKAKARAARDRARAARIAARAKAQAAKARARAAKPFADEPAAPAAGSKTTPALEASSRPSPRVPASAYVAPPRKTIKEELAKIMPMIKRSDLTGLDWWQLYTMHADIVKYGRKPEELARKFIKGYKKKK